MMEYCPTCKTTVSVKKIKGRSFTDFYTGQRQANYVHSCENCYSFIRTSIENELNEPSKEEILEVKVKKPRHIAIKGKKRDDKIKKIQMVLQALNAKMIDEYHPSMDTLLEMDDSELDKKCKWAVGVLNGYDFNLLTGAKNE